MELRGPDSLVLEAKDRWQPVHTYCLFSGGNDSGVLAHRCRDHFDELLFIDTGTALPGVEEHVVAFAELLDKPLLVLRAEGEYRRMVLEHGFPGKGQHGRAYIRLKERQIEEAKRRAKIGHPRSASVLFLSGVRRDESRRRAAVEPFSERWAAKFVSPLVDWPNALMSAYREREELPVSDVAALMHRSGECNCGAFAKAEEERGMLEALFPEWFCTVIEPLEREAEAAGLRWCRWGGYDLERVQAAGSEDPGLLCQSCPTRQL